MSHFLDRLTFFNRTADPFADGHGITTREDRRWEEFIGLRQPAVPAAKGPVNNPGGIKLDSAVTASRAEVLGDARSFDLESLESASVLGVKFAITSVSF